MHEHCDNPAYFGIFHARNEPLNDNGACLIQGNSGWIMLDLGSPRLITAVTTRGRPDAPQWVTKYTISVSDDGLQFIDADCATQDAREFCNGNTDQTTPVTNKLMASGVQAQYIRLNVKGFKDDASLRMGVTTCSTESSSSPCSAAGPTSPGERF